VEEQPRRVEEQPRTARHLYSVAEVQQLLGIGRTTTYELIATRQLPAVRINRSLRVMDEDLRIFIERNRL
jgi:excisionase family DNA binding protein